MPIQQYPKYKAVPDKMLEVPQPGIGGLNLKDLEFEQEVNQSPYMKNVMYRNGAFAKRYGQAIHSSYNDTVYAMTSFGGAIFIHSGTKIYMHDGTSASEVGTGIPKSAGVFITFLQKLYYMTSNGFYEYKNGSFSAMETYVPDILINCAPDGSDGADTIDQLNVIGDNFNFVYNGTANTTKYRVEPYDPDEIIDWNKTPKVYVEGGEWAYDPTGTENKSFKIVTDDATYPDEHVVIFNPAPGEGDSNVMMTFTRKSSVLSGAKTDLLKCRYYDTYGGEYNSRVFLAGDGKSMYYWCAPYDITYWPEMSYDKLGNTEDDITGFGRQYTALIAFKPRETYQIVQDVEQVSFMDESIDKYYYKGSLVNPRVGCDAPYSIQVINNLLTWFSSVMGVCTLVSTNLADERNIRVLSRNVEYTNNLGIHGILDIAETPANVVSADFDKKYFLAFPTDGTCFVWDYEISPYFYSSANGETPPAKLSWFYFDNFYVKSFLNTGKELLYLSKYNKTFLFPMEQCINGNFTSADEWTCSGTLTVSENVGTYTESAGPIILFGGMRQDVVDPGTYFITATVKNTASGNVTIEASGGPFTTGSVTFEPSNEFVTKNFVANVKSGGSLAIPWQLVVNVPVGETIEIKNVMVFDTGVLWDKYSRETIAKFHPESPEYVEKGSTANIAYDVSMEDEIVKLDMSFNDLDFDGDGKAEAIESFYMTPFMQFGAVEMLKNVRNVYIQCRGDTRSFINISYMTDESSVPEKDPEPIDVDGGSSLWADFDWGTFSWFMNIWGNTFRRRCNIKKVQMCAVLFENDELGRDMSVAHVGFQYQLVKYIK